MVGQLLSQVPVGLLELLVLDLQDLDDPGHELQLSAQGVAFGADSGQVLLLLGRAGLRGLGLHLRERIAGLAAIPVTY
jgi:hypothetical protein